MRAIRASWIRVHSRRSLFTFMRSTARRYADIANLLPGCNRASHRSEGGAAGLVRVVRTREPAFGPSATTKWLVNPGFGGRTWGLACR